MVIWVAGTAVAAVECKDTQFKSAKDCDFMRVRHSLVPVANFGSNMSWDFVLN